MLFSVNFFIPKLMKIRWSSFFLKVFCTSLPNQVEHTWLKSQFHICIYERAQTHFIDKDLDSEIQYYGPCKKCWKKSKTSHLDFSGHIEGDIMYDYEKKKWKKVKSQDSMDKTNFFLNTLPFNPFSILSTWPHVGAPQKIREKWT